MFSEGREILVSTFQSLKQKPKKTVKAEGREESQRMKPTSAVVIGGGIIGISSALQMAKRGIKVTILEEQKGERQ